jgi:large subunit ribosomal protein L10
MNRAEKVETVSQLTDRFARAPLVVVTEYRGLNVAQMSDLRRKLRAVDGEYLVSKNTLAAIAIRESRSTALAPMLVGPLALAFGFTDAVAVAKVVKDFAKENDKLLIRGAVLDGAALNAKQVEQLATMPSRDELRAQLLRLLNTPATNLVRLLKAPAQQLVQVLHAKSTQES